MLLLGILLSGCYPKDELYIEDLDLVLTNYDKNTNFSSNKTYAISDSVVKLFSSDYTDPDGNGKPDFLKQSAANIIISKVNSNMAAYGYTRVNQNQNPDVTVLVTCFESTYVYYTYDYYYWGWYYPYYWYYPYPTSMYSSQSTGTIMMMMLDNGELNDADMVPAVWTAVLNGLLDASHSGMSARVNVGIDQAFSQSTYLKH